MADEMKARRRQGVTRAQLYANRSAGLKRCFCCKKTKPFAAFANDKARSDGLSPKCRECGAQYRSENAAALLAKGRARKKAARAADPEKENRAARERYAVNIGRERARAKTKRAANPEACRASSRKWREANREEANAKARIAKKTNVLAIRAYNAAYREANRERRAAYNAAYRAANAENIKLKNAAYAKANAGKLNKNTARRNAAKLRAIPAWADLKRIAEFYAEAAQLTKENGILHEVDHVIPLRGKTVCGLHVETNLQILSAAANRSKSNRFDLAA